MIYVANQLFKTHPEGIEQQFAACSGLSQSISEEFDRGTELQAQTLQQACESWGQFYSSIWQVKDPQEFFMLLSSQLHASAEQTQHYWHALHSLSQQIQEKMFALEQTFSPMITEALIDITPASIVSEKVITELNTESKAKSIAHSKANPAAQVLPKLELKPAATQKPKAKVDGTKIASKLTSKTTLTSTPKTAENEVKTAVQTVTKATPKATTKAKTKAATKTVSKTATPPEATPQGQTSEKKRNSHNSTNNRSSRNQS